MNTLGPKNIANFFLSYIDPFDNCVGGIFSSKLINVHARLFGTLEYARSVEKEQHFLGRIIQGRRKRVGRLGNFPPKY